VGAAVAVSGPWVLRPVELQFQPRVRPVADGSTTRCRPAGCGEAIDQSPEQWFSSRLGSLITGEADSSISSFRTNPRRPSCRSHSGKQLFCSRDRQNFRFRAQGLAGAGGGACSSRWKIQAEAVDPVQCIPLSHLLEPVAQPTAGRWCGAAGKRNQGSGSWGHGVAQTSWVRASAGPARPWLDPAFCLFPGGGGLDQRVSQVTLGAIARRAVSSPVAGQKACARPSPRCAGLRVLAWRCADCGLRWGSGMAGVHPHCRAAANVAGPKRKGFQAPPVELPLRAIAICSWGG